MRYLFDDFEVDADRLELLRGGQPVRVEPLVFELLAYLLAHRDRLVPKEELVERLWQGRAISDAALSRCLYQARRALGDSSSQPRYLTTVHGRGVRLAEGVAVRELVAGERRAETVPLPTPPGHNPEPELAPEPARQFEEPRPAATFAASAAPAVPRRRPLVGAAVGAALVATAVTLLFLAGPAEREPGAAPLSAPADGDPGAAALAESGAERPILAVLPLSIGGTVTSPDEASELELVALSIVDLLRLRLTSVPGLEVRPFAVSAQAVISAGSLRETAARVGATHLVGGSLTATERQARVELEMYELLPDRPVRSTPLGSFDLPRLAGPERLAQFFRVRDSIAQRAVRLVGSPYRIGGAEPGGSRQPEAWRLYVLAYQRLSDDFCGGSRPAIELLEQAIELDADFGLAWEALATARYNRFWACGEDASILDSVIEADERALAVAPELREPRLRRIAMRIETGRVEEAYQLVLEELESFPDDPRALNAQTYALRYAGFLSPSAASLDRLLELDPLCFAVGAMGGSPNTYLYQGRYDRFLDVVPLSEMAYHRWYRGFVELLRERNEEARRVLEPAFRSGSAGIFGGLSHALLALLDGDAEAARSIVGAVARQRHQLGAADGEISYKQAQIYALAGDPERALAELERTVDQGFFCFSCFERDPALTSLRNEARWGQVLAVARARHLAFAERFGLQPELG